MIESSKKGIIRSNFQHAQGGLEMFQTKTRISAVAAVVLMVTCTHSRETPGDHNLIGTSLIPVASLPAFTDCVSAAFRDKSLGVLNMGMVSLANRRQVRSNMTRNELVHSSVGAVLSADIYPDGKVELYETSLSFHRKYEDEKAEFTACVQRYK